MGGGEYLDAPFVVDPWLQAGIHGPIVGREAPVDKRSQPLLDAAPSPLFANEYVQPPIPVFRLTTEVLPQDVLLHPVDLKVAKGHAVPEANGGERMSRVQSLVQEAVLIVTPELFHSGVVEPHLQERRVAQRAQVGVLGRPRSRRAQMGHGVGGR